MHLTDAVETAKLWFTEIQPDETILFDMVDPQENIQVCEFIDPYEGSFSMDGINGFTDLNEFLQKNPFVQNLRIAPRNRKKK